MTESGDIKSSTVEKIADLVLKLAGPLADEAGMMLGDKLRVYRVRNWIKTVQKTERLLRDSGLPANAVPPRLFLPIMEASSIEDKETIQDMAVMVGPISKSGGVQSHDKVRCPLGEWHSL